jgi:hypothetical protein
MVLSEAKRKLLEKYLRAQLPQTQAAEHAISRRPAGGQAPLSLVQEQVWRRALSTSGISPFYNESITITRTGCLEASALERSFTEVIRRHEAWRTTFDTIEGQPIQVIHPAPSSVAIPIVDLRGIAEGAREAEALRLATEDARRGFDLKQGPLVRATLVTVDDESHRLYLTMHQSVVDGVSVYQVLPSELTVLYDAFSAGKSSPLPELPIQYADFACWERQWLSGNVLASQLAYWRNELGGVLPVLRWPTKPPRPSLQTFRGVIRMFGLPKQLSLMLKKVSQQEGVTLFMTLLAGFTALLHFYTQQEDIVVGTVAPAGRKRPEVQGLLGYFLNPVALRADLSGDPTFRGLLQQAREAVLGALSHDDVPFEYIVDELKIRPDPSRNPLFQVAISLAPPVPVLSEGWDQTPMDVESGGAKWDLYLELSVRASGILGRAQYNPDLFDTATITRTLEDLQALLNGAILNPGQRLSQLLASVTGRPSADAFAIASGG